MSKHHELRASSDTVQIGVVSNTDLPALTVESGDTVSIDTWNAWGNSVTPETSIQDVIDSFASFAGVGPHDLTGPIEIRGAEPGNVLKVEILDLRLRRHAFNLNLPGHFGTGLLPEKISEGAIRHFDLGERQDAVEFFPGVSLPVRPFLGYMGVSPRDDGPHSSIPPGPHGGNIDVLDLRVGSTLYLPVWNQGAMFSIGDAHACQGYGEVNLTTMEASVEEAVLRLTVLTGGHAITSPRAETTDSLITLAFAESLLDASKAACWALVDELSRQVPSMSHNDAYALCAMAMDLKVNQVVNERMGIQASLPKSIFSPPLPWFDQEAGWIAKN